jgi:hypothetical protein
MRRRDRLGDGSGDGSGPAASGDACDWPADSGSILVLAGGTWGSTIRKTTWIWWAECGYLADFTRPAFRGVCCLAVLRPGCAHRMFDPKRTTRRRHRRAARHVTASSESALPKPGLVPNRRRASELLALLASAVGRPALHLPFPYLGCLCRRLRCRRPCSKSATRALRVSGLRAPRPV